jgi:hypothetical protein
MDYDAENFKTQQRKHWETAPIDRHRVFFTIKDKDKAIKCYKDLSFQTVPVEGARYKLYLVKQEEIFTKYGDIEAEKFAAAQEKRKKEDEDYYAAKKQGQLAKSRSAYEEQDRGFERGHHEGAEQSYGEDTK